MVERRQAAASRATICECGGWSTRCFFSSVIEIRPRFHTSPLPLASSFSTIVALCHSRHRRHIYVFREEHVEDGCKDGDSSIYCRGPIHRLASDGDRNGKQGKDECDREVSQADQIYREAPPAQRPSPAKQRLVSQSLEDDAGYGDEVRAEECGRSDGQDGIERHSRAEIDEREQCCDRERRQDRIQGDVPAWADLCCRSAHSSKHMGKCCIRS